MPLAFLPIALKFVGANWKLLTLACAAIALGALVLGTKLTIEHLKTQVGVFRTSNTQLHDANVLEHATVTKLVKVYVTNQKVCTAAESAAKQNLVIAKSEAVAVKVRAANYGNISHAIQAAPADPSPVSPVVRDAVDSLFDDAQASGG